MSEFNGKEFWGRVKILGKQKGVKMVDICHLIEMQYPNFKNQIYKGTFPCLVDAYKIAQFFGVPVEYLLTGATNNPLFERNVYLEKRVSELEKFYVQVRSASSVLQ